MRKPFNKIVQRTYKNVYSFSTKTKDLALNFVSRANDCTPCFSLKIQKFKEPEIL